MGNQVAQPSGKVKKEDSQEAKQRRREKLGDTLDAFLR